MKNCSTLLLVAALATGCSSGGDKIIIPPIITVASVSVTPNSPSARVGEAVVLTATPLDASGAPLAGRAFPTWTTGDLNVGNIATVAGFTATVTSGVAGTTQITATIEGKVATLTYTSIGTAAGSWHGTLSGGSQLLTMTLVENSGVVNGSGTLTNTPSGTRAYVISGAFANPKLNLTLSSGTTTPFNLQALVAGKHMQGSVSGSGFNNETIVMDRP